MRSFKLLFFLGIFFSGLLVQAQDMDSTTVTVVEEDVIVEEEADNGANDESEGGELTISGYVDVYYEYNWNHPPYVPNNPVGVPQPSGFGFQNQGRIFDIKHNQFSLGLAQVKLDYVTKRSEAVIDLTFGPNAELGNFGNIFGTMMSIKQAYINYMLTDKLSFTAGQFGTHVGYELIDAPANFNYSLSYLFGNGPFYHTGLKANYQITDEIGIMAGVVNGWDEMWDFNKGKDAIAQLSYVKDDKIAMFLNYIGGDDKNGLSFPTLGGPANYGSTVPVNGAIKGNGQTVPDSIKTYAHLFDFTGTMQVTDKFKVGLNAAFGFGMLKLDPTSPTGYSMAHWGGAALYLQYALMDNFDLGLRAENFNDPDAVRYVGAALGAGTYNEFTLTGNIKLSDGHLLVKPEVRLDLAGQKSFTKYTANKSDSKKVATATNTQLTTGIAFVYLF